MAIVGFKSLTWDSEGSVWVWNHILENVVWDSDQVFEIQITFWKMMSEIQIQDLRFRSHSSKCCLRLKSTIWVSDHLLQHVVWDSNPPFESQISFCNMLLETQILHLSFRSHFKNVVWDSNPWFEFQILFCKMSFETQIQHLSFRSLCGNCYLRLRSSVWDSDHILENVVWDSDTGFDIQITF